MNRAARLQAALYAPTAYDLTQPLPAIADVLMERLEAISAAPLVTDVDALLRELGGLTAILMRLRLALVREAESREPDRATEGSCGYER